MKSKGKDNVPVTFSSGHQDSSHIPDLHSIHQDAVLQAQVAKRLKELTDSEKPGTKLKSLRGCTVEVMAANHVKWPHKYVLSCVAKERITCLLLNGWLAFVAS